MMTVLKWELIGYVGGNWRLFVARFKTNENSKTEVDQLRTKLETIFSKVTQYVI